MCGDRSEGPGCRLVNDGYVCTVNADELVITRNGEVVHEQPVISSSANWARAKSGLWAVFA